MGEGEIRSPPLLTALPLIENQAPLGDMRSRKAGERDQELSVPSTQDRQGFPLQKNYTLGIFLSRSGNRKSSPRVGKNVVSQARPLQSPTSSLLVTVLVLPDPCLLASLPPVWSHCLPISFQPERTLQCILDYVISPPNGLQWLPAVCTIMSECPSSGLIIRLWPRCQLSLSSPSPGPCVPASRHRTSNETSLLLRGPVGFCTWPNNTRTT